MHADDSFRFDGDEYDPTQLRLSIDRNRVVSEDTIEMYKTRTIEAVFEELALPINDHDRGEWCPIYCRACGRITDREMAFEQVYEDPSGYVYVFDSRGQQISLDRTGGE